MIQFLAVGIGNPDQLGETKMLCRHCEEPIKEGEPVIPENTGGGHSYFLHHHCYMERKTKRLLQDLQTKADQVGSAVERR